MNLHPLRHELRRSVLEWRAVAHRLRNPQRPVGYCAACHVAGRLLWVSGVGLLAVAIAAWSMSICPRLIPWVLLLSGINQVVGAARRLWADRLAVCLVGFASRSGAAMP